MIISLWLGCLHVWFMIKLWLVNSIVGLHNLHTHVNLCNPMCTICIIHINLYMLVCTHKLVHLCLHWLFFTSWFVQLWVGLWVGLSFSQVDLYNYELIYEWVCFNFYDAAFHLLLLSWLAKTDALPSPGVNPLEGSPKCNCGKLGLGRRSRLLAL